MAAMATHGFWIDHYTNDAGTPCCGQRDCLVVHARLLTQDGTTAQVEVNGVTMTLRQGQVHQSEDAQDYWCAKGDTTHISAETTRCVFVAVGG